MDARDQLRHVMWIGGGPQSGKTTLSRLLAGKFDLKIYNLDWHGARRPAPDRSRPLARAWLARTLDERWVAPTPRTLYETTVAIWDEGFALVIEDLLARPRTRPIVAEGPGAFPWRVAPLIRSATQAIFFVPTVDVRLWRAERRWGVGQTERWGDAMVDLEGALVNVAARDALLDERIAMSCMELGLRCERDDGSRDLDARLALLEEHFRPHLPDSLNV